MKKKHFNFKQNERQISLLKKYYHLDEEKKLITVPLYYENSTDILNMQQGNLHHYAFKSEVLTLVNEIITKAPAGYKLNIDFKINNYLDFKPKDLIESFNDTLELAQYQARKKRMLKELIAAFLVLVGIILLFFMVIGKNYQIFGTGVKEEIIVEVINIAAWVFVWEAFNMLFLEHSEEVKFALKIRSFVNQIAMYDGANNLVEVERNEDIFGKWENEGYLKRTGHMMLLISSMGFIFISFYNLYSLFVAVDTLPFTLRIITIIFSISMSLFTFLAGIGGLSLYLERKNKFLAFVKPYSIFLTLTIMTYFLIAIIGGNLRIMLTTGSSFILNIMYLLGYYINRQ